MRRFLGASAVLIVSLGWLGEARATLGTCDTAGPIEVEATGGVLGPTAYARLKLAFDAVNAGTHTGAVSVEVCASPEPAFFEVAVLHSSGAGSANYTSLSVRPLLDNLTIVAEPPAGRGVIELNGADNVTIDGDNPRTANTHRDLTIENVAASTDVASSVIRIATSAAVTSANGNTIRNLILNGNVTHGNDPLITSTTSSSGVSFGVYVGGNGGTVANFAPLPLTSSPAAAPSGTTVNALTIENNAINRCARGVFFNGASTSTSTGVTVSRNVIGAAGTPSPATTVYGKGIQISGTTAVSVVGNTIRNIVSYVGIPMAGVELSANIGTGPNTIQNNTITTVVLNTTGNVAVRGIAVLATGGAYTIRGNTVNGVEGFSTTTTNQPAGIFVNSIVGSVTLDGNRVRTVYNHGTFGCQGISLNGGANHTVRNNFVSDINQVQTGGNSFSPASAVVGIRVNTGNGHKIHHNTVSLSGPALGTASANNLTAAFAISGLQSGIDVRNNLFSNTMTGGTTSVAHVAVFLAASGTSTMNLTWNNNAYYTGSSAGVHGIAHVGSTYTVVPAGPATWAGLYTAADFAPGATSPDANLRAYTSTLSGAGTNDDASFATTAAAPFVSATDLHIAPGATPLASAGAATGVTADLDGETRDATPDIGADEFSGPDGIPPILALTPLGNAGTTANRTLLVTVSDPSGVPTSGTGLPVVYFRKGTSGSYTASTCTHVAGNEYSCVLDYTLLPGGSVAVGDTVQYYLAAQDVPGNVAVDPGAGAGAGGLTAHPPAAATPPASPHYYVVVTGLSGARTLCASGCDYATLTGLGGAFHAINEGALLGDLVLEIAGDLTAEPGTIALQEWAEDGPGGYGLLIRPTGSPRSIVGDGVGIVVIKLHGADRVTIDGSVDGLGTDRSLTIRHPFTLGGGVMWIGSLGPGAGCRDVTIRNTILEGDVGAIGYNFGLFVGNTSGAVDGPGNDSFTLENSHIRRVTFGVQVFGATGIPVQSTVVRDNLLGDPVVADGLDNRAVVLGHATGAVVHGNTIRNVAMIAGQHPSNVAFGPVAIDLQQGVTASVVTGNRITGVRYTGALGRSGLGIDIDTGSTASDLLLANNMISDIGGNGDDDLAEDSIVGVRILGDTGGVRVYHNAVHLGSGGFAGQATGTLSAAFHAGAAVTNLDVRNNVFANGLDNTATGGDLALTISADAASGTPYATIDRNDYFPSGPAGKVGRFGGVDRDTLGDWQAATGQDAGSLSVDPSFVSATDLHLDISGGPSPLENAGATLAEVAVDLDGQARGTLPEIGADEVLACLAVNCSAFSTVCALALCSPAGLSGNCDLLLPAPVSTACGDPSDTECDNPDHCSGFDGTCVSAFEPAGSACGDAEGACIYADSCDGLGGCTDQGFKPVTTACGDPTDTDCDDPDHCSGTDATCISEGGPGEPEACDGLDNDCDGIVDDAAMLTVEADRHTIGTGSHPGSVKTPLTGLSVGIYSKATGSCARDICGGISWQHYACIVASCEEVTRQSTDSSGRAVFTLPAGDYLVIGSDGADKHLGVSASDLACGDEMRKYLQELVTANGKTHPGKTTVRTGSELLIVEPEYVEWTTTQELYPYVFDSLGDWAVMTSVTPPEGFVADHTSLTAEVTSELEAVQFTITDVGSDWVPTKVEHRIRHGARKEVVLSRIGILLGADLALAKRLDRAGHPLGEDGQPLPREGFDPRLEPPAELIGWIEPSAADVAWTVKYRVNGLDPVHVRITDSQGRLVKLLVAEVQPRGERSVSWDGRDMSGRYLPQGDYFLTLSSGAWTESSRILTIAGSSPLPSRPKGRGGPHEIE